ncbi:HU family DNA-binding protein [Verminephrobacter eiseniae]|uniref:HU family DNA-binding protein n=1 Tax=Verminephrobacter eiseniae TaxID=364317 RepID=UPI002A60577F|nr:DNA-binding protein HU [Verminephrobacter eiseniae]MCW5291677.1 DNA-binding protein HU [Verminephrobacter eiseniae]MCW8183434.1 DNA-binding protein HU [Verminephrobacter eiseniae]MCW8221701.1 DNA-binding protein HU [Verminephrobacter eiseniae]MCW8233449.1 DNA-binding protein HU [Verminephrobacter eiseniae]
MDKEETIAAEHGLPTTKISGIIRTFLGAVVHGDKVTLVGFGILEAILAKPRTGRHPRTGQKVDIGEKCPRSSPHRSPPLPVNNARPLKKLCEARSRCQFSLYTGPVP